MIYILLGEIVITYVNTMGWGQVANSVIGFFFMILISITFIDFGAF